MATISLWDWTTSNGEATEQQVQEAYKAITGQGRTYKFDHLVWNDMVAFINTNIAQKQGGWLVTDKVLCVEDTQMWKDFVLTAQRFNSLCTQLHWNYWTWRTTPTKKGYIGPRNFNGKSQIGITPDKVYGWYFLELMEIANKLILAQSNEFHANQSILSGNFATLSLVDAKAQLPLKADSLIGTLDVTKSGLSLKEFLHLKALDNNYLLYDANLEYDQKQVKVFLSAFDQFDLTHVADLESGNIILKASDTFNMDVDKDELLSRERHLLIHQGNSSIDNYSDMLERVPAYNNSTTDIDVDAFANANIRQNAPMDIEDTSSLEEVLSEMHTYGAVQFDKEIEQKFGAKASVQMTETKQFKSDVNHQDVSQISLSKLDTVKIDEDAYHEAIITPNIETEPGVSIDTKFTINLNSQQELEARAIVNAQSYIDCDQNIIIGSFDAVQFSHISSYNEHKTNVDVDASVVTKLEFDDFEVSQAINTVSVPSVVGRVTVGSYAKHTNTIEDTLSAGSPQAVGADKISEHNITASVESARRVLAKLTGEHRTDITQELIASIYKDIDITVSCNDAQPDLELISGHKREISSDALILKEAVLDIESGVYTNASSNAVKNQSIHGLLGDAPSEQSYVTFIGGTSENAKGLASIPIYLGANNISALISDAILDVKDRKYVELESVHTTIALNERANASYYEILSMKSDQSITSNVLASVKSKDSNRATITHSTLVDTVASLETINRHELPLSAILEANLNEEVTAVSRQVVGGSAISVSYAIPTGAHLSTNEEDMVATDITNSYATGKQTTLLRKLFTVSSTQSMTNVANMELEDRSPIEMCAVSNTYVNYVANIGAKLNETLSSVQSIIQSKTANMVTEEKSKGKLYYGIWNDPNIPTPTSLDGFDSEDIIDAEALVENGFSHPYDTGYTYYDRRTFAFPKSLGALIHIGESDLAWANIIDQFNITELGDYYVYCDKPTWMENSLEFYWKNPPQPPSS